METSLERKSTYLEAKLFLFRINVDATLRAVRQNKWEDLAGHLVV